MEPKILMSLDNQLRSSVGQIEDPQVVAELAIQKLAERFRYYKGLGTYEWREGKWMNIYKEQPQAPHFRAARKLAEIGVGLVIDDLHKIGEHEAAQTLRILAQKSRWLISMARDVCYKALRRRIPESEACLIRDPSDMLQTQGFLSVSNGVIDLKTGDLYKHEDKKDLFFTHSLTTRYNPNAQAPNFFKALEIWTNRNPDLIEYLQWALGIAITGFKSYEHVFWLHGSPKTRKELLLEIVASILEDYAMPVHCTVFKDEYAGRKLLRLINGKRMVYCTNYLDGSPMCKMALVQFYEYDKLTVNYNSGRKVYSLTNLYIASSGFPTIVDGIDPFRARVHPIIFQDSPKHHKLFDSTFIHKIMQEKEGILAWLVEGAKKYVQEPNVARKTLAFSDLAMYMKQVWVEQLVKAHTAQVQNKKPLPTRKGQTQNKNRQ